MSSCRKIQKTMHARSDGQRRRSPRISALDASKQNLQSRTVARSRLKRKHDGAPHFKKLAKQVWKGKDDNAHNAHHSTDCVDWRCSRHGDDHAITNGKAASTLPSKQILELVLDTLQRRDAYEIFAEPVDPDEVEDYYEIIKEPMDFGTMRAKLHEGMYHNLQQFEHDVFLIPENAMHFNSSATIYFRQARAIHELARKVFDALKTDPEKFVSEFSGTRRRSMRKALSDTRDSRLAISKPVNIHIVSSKLENTLTTKKNSEGFAGRANCLSSTSRVADRHEDKSLVLMNVQQADTNYKDSLMSFVKDLGPVAQMVAKHKLLYDHKSINGDGLGSETNICAAKQKSNARVLKTFRDFAVGSSHPFLEASRRNIIDLTEDGQENKKQKSNSSPSFGKKATENIERKGRTNMTGRDLNCSSSRNRSRSNNINDHNHVGRPVILALENSHSNVSEYKSRNIKKSSCTSTSTCTTNGVGSSSISTSTNNLISSQFTFDLPFLRARLNQMNHHHRPRHNHQPKLNCTRQAESMANNPFFYNQSFDQHDTNLTLHL